MRSTRPTPSTWPCTKCPPKRAPTASGKSKLTMRPAAVSPNEVRSSVSRERSAEKDLLSRSTTVKQQPLTAMLAPMASSCAKSGTGAFFCGTANEIVSRAPSSERARLSIFPRRSMIPVNIVKISFDSKIRAEAVQREIRERAHVACRTRGMLCNRHGSLAEHARSIKQNHFVDEVLFKHCAIEGAAGFENHAENFATPKLVRDFAQVHAAVAGAQAHNFDAALSELARFRGILRLGGENDDAARRLCGVGDDGAAQRHAQFGIHDG